MIANKGRGNITVRDLSEVSLSAQRSDTIQGRGGRGIVLGGGEVISMRLAEDGEDLV